jgi:hypothetical protein
MNYKLIFKEGNFSSDNLIKIEPTDESIYGNFGYNSQCYSDKEIIVVTIDINFKYRSFENFWLFQIIIVILYEIKMYVICIFLYKNVN